MNPFDVVGHLLIVRPLEFIPGVQTSGTPDTIRCDVVDLSRDGKLSHDVLWCGRWLVRGLRKQLSQLVFGFMATSIPQIPPVQCCLADATPFPDAVKVAETWLDLHPEFVNREVIWESVK